MLDSDLAMLYQVETKRVNEAVKNNPEKFPNRFSWVLTGEEEYNLRSKFSTSSLPISGYGGRRYRHRVFTEQGAAMLATVLKTRVAAEVSIRIMDAFVALRRYVSTNLLEQKYINTLVMEDHDKIQALEASFEKLEEKKKISEIYFNGQIYDAYSKIQEIFECAKEKLVVIDAYADKTILDIVKRLDVSVTIVTKSHNLLTKQDIDRYNKQYHNLDVIFDDSFHDRYFILDDQTVYHCGASINRIGYKTFSINLIEDEEIRKALAKKLSNLRSQFVTSK